MSALPRHLTYGTIPNGGCHVFVGDSPLSACRSVWRDAVVLYQPDHPPPEDKRVCTRCRIRLEFANIIPLDGDLVPGMMTKPATSPAEDDEGPEPEAEREDETP